MLPSTVIRLANDFENVVAIKEAAGDLVQAMQLIKDKPKDFLVISGDDMIALPIVLAGGCWSYISNWSRFSKRIFRNDPIRIE